MKARKAHVATAAGVAVLLAGGFAAAAEAAVTAHVTGDDGNPTPLSTAAPISIRNMNVRAYVHVDDAAGARSYRWAVVDQSGTSAAATSGCWRSSSFPNDDALVTYRGNQTYTLRLSLFNDTTCGGTATATHTYTWVVAAGVGLVAPPTRLLTRPKNSVVTNRHALDFVGTPGASRYEIRFAKNAALQPDGSIAGAEVKEAFFNPATGKVEVIGAREPGTYTAVARAYNGGFFTPWSPPITFKLISPFDLRTSFPDQRGPSYQVRGVLGETTAGGRVTVSIAKGRKGKKFKTLGRAKVNRKGVFKLRFTLRGYGFYRLRYKHAGNSRVQKGTVYEVVRIRKIFG
jgi:hypothetical protein